MTQGTLEGDIVPGPITFYRLQSTSDSKLRAYIAQGEVLPVATRSFGGIGIFAIPEMGRFYRHVLIEKNYPHHGAVAFVIMEKLCTRCSSTSAWSWMKSTSTSRRECCTLPRIRLPEQKGQCNRTSGPSCRSFPGMAGLFFCCGKKYREISRTD